MPARWGYWAKSVALMQAMEAKPFARLRRAWPNLVDSPDEQWQAQQHPQGGTIILWPRPEDGGSIPLEAFGEPREASDGLTFYPTREPPSKEELIRSEQHRQPGTWVQLSSGDSLYIALATATPRELIIRAGGGIAFGKFQNEYGLLGHALYEPFFSEAGINFGDPRLGRLIFLALQQSYFVTEEMVEDLGWLSDADIGPIVHAIQGVNPKASAAEPAGSASAAPTTPTSP